MFEIPRTFHLNSERLEQFLKQIAFSTCFWSFIGPNTLLNNLNSNWKKIIGIQKPTGKFRKYSFSTFPLTIEL